MRSLSPDQIDLRFDTPFDHAALGHGLPAPVEALIGRAGQLRHLPHEAEPLLLEARRQAPKHPATLIALYRFYFYGHRLADARAIASESLAVARDALGPDFGSAPPGEMEARFDASVRFYLFALKGYAYLSLRLGELDAGRAALIELRRLDPQDRVGGAVLARVLARLGRDPDEVDDAPAPPRGWSVMESSS